MSREGSFWGVIRPKGLGKDGWSFDGDEDIIKALLYHNVLWYRRAIVLHNGPPRIRTEDQPVMSRPL